MFNSSACPKRSGFRSMRSQWKRTLAVTISGGGVMKALITVLLLVLSLSPGLLIAQEGMILVAGGFVALKQRTHIEGSGELRWVTGLGTRWAVA